MPKTKTRTEFVCTACENVTVRWEGQCRSCSAWNTIIERRDAGRFTWLRSDVQDAVHLADASVEDLPRMSLSSGEVNRVLGGGIVPGSLVLLAGDPGIGKSTMLLQVAEEVARRYSSVFYVTGEESVSQVKMRADRLGIDGQSLYILTQTNVEEVLARLDERLPALAVIDSIQTMYDPELSSHPGNVSQIRECARRLLEWGKANNVPIILTGHVTKGGDIAGPRVLEHMVDAALYMEGDAVSSWRLLRAVKNRFGSTNEVGVLEMTGMGLRDVEDPSKSFLLDRPKGAMGSVVVPILEGNRALLVEIQALTAPSTIPTPRRVATGYDAHRLLLVCSVAMRTCGIPLSDYDIIVNVTGGLKIAEPAADLGVALAIASSFRGVPMPGDVASVGEVGLSGEIRRAPQTERRVKEAARHGLRKCLVPRNTDDIACGEESLHYQRVDTLAQAINMCLPITRHISGAAA
ncbi:MAG: DNA repair protein RadA [Chloroflexi bacterium]|nr:DNA repair protein RadA [Chloroflexota bacterium]